jgi:hypothetical protein
MNLVLAGHGTPPPTSGTVPVGGSAPTRAEHGDAWLVVERPDAHVVGVASDGARSVAVVGSGVGADADAVAADVLERASSGRIVRAEGDLVVLVVDADGCTAVVGSGNHRLFAGSGPGGGTVVGTNLRSVAAALDPTHPADRSEEDFLLGFGFVPPPATVYAGVEQLPPGVTHRWGRTPLHVDEAPSSDAVVAVQAAAEVEGFDAAVEELHRRFLDTVEELAGDDPDAAVLLGGLDSALVAATLVRLGKRVTTFTYGFGDPRYEQRDVEAITTALGVAQRWVHISPEVVMEGLVHFGDVFSQPGPQPHYQLHTLHGARTVRAAGFDRVLTGDGCDAVFLGYPTVSRRARLMERLGDVPDGLWAPLRGALAAPAVERKLGHVARMGRSTLDALGLEPPARGHLPTRYLDDVALSRLRSAPPPHQRASVPERRRQLADGLEHLDPVRLAFHGNSMTGQSRIKVDGTVLATGVRQASPFTHPRVRDFVAALPVEYLRPPGAPSGAAGKALMVEMVRRHELLPPKVLELPKQSPAESPIDRWYAGPLRSDLLDLLGHLPFEWNRSYLDELLAPKAAEQLYRSRVAISHNALQAVGLLASYASFHRP